MTETIVLPPEASSYLQHWAESLQQVLGQITSSSLPCALLQDAPPEATSAAETDFLIVVACSGGLRGEMTLRLSAPSTLRLAQIFMSEPLSPETPVANEHREAATELLRQVAGIVASAVKPDWGEVALRLEASAAPPSWPASSVAWLRVAEGDALLEMQLSAALVAALRAQKADAPSESTVVSASLETGQVKLDLLMDVELGVTLRFGSRRLLLREILELNPGSVVDLDRQVKEPVDLLLDGRLVARGEVVVMDGNYGVRLTEIGPGVR